MKTEDKILLRKNFTFISVFAIVFIFYCSITSRLTEAFQLTKTASADVDDKKIIVIDPGHGGEDGGTIGKNGVLEKDINLKMSKYLSELFRFAGYEAVQTRTEDIMLYDKNVNFKGKKKILDLAARLDIANSASPDLFIGIHMNAFPQERYSGLTVYYSDYSPISRNAAESLRKDVVSYLQPKNNREIKSGKDIYLLSRAEHPAILIECGFLSNPEECALLSTEEYRRKLSLIIFSSLSSFLEEN